MEMTTVAGIEITDESAREQLRADSVAQAFRVSAEANAERVALRTKGDGVAISWGQYWERGGRFAAGLRALGQEAGQTIGLMMSNRPEFHIADAGALILGMTPFSIYNTYTPEQIEYLVEDSGNTVFVCESAFLPVLRKVAEAKPQIAHIVVCDGAGDGDRVLSYDDLMARGDPEFDAGAAVDEVDPDSILTLIYTSGTTGPPKGVQITHANIVAAVRGFDQMITFPEGPRIVSYLPMAHIAERMVGHYLPMFFAATVTTCEDPRQVVSYLPEVRPNWFFAVPRIWEKLKAALEASVASEQDPERKKGMEWAHEVGLRKVRAEQSGEGIDDQLAAEYAKADEMVFSKIRANLGLDELLSVNVGAAPTPPEVIEFFHAIGIPVAELWGMSETCGAGTVNPPDRVKIGTVGPPSPGVEIKLADDGEILMRGPMVMAGYRNQPDKTAEAIDSEGWLHTGDIGEIDDDGYLKIVDRKKELIINAAGKNMSPANIEAKLKTIPLVGQAIAIGDRRPYLVALLTLDPDVAPAWATAQGIDEADVEKLASDERVIEEVQRGVEEVNRQLARVEQLKKFRILPTEWQPGGEELTPTMKLKRKPVQEKYAAEIEALYT